MKIGFIGLGIMGFNMAKNLIEKGHQLVVYNRSKDKAAKLVEKGVILAETPALLDSEVEIVFTMLSEPAVVDDIAFGKEGFINQLKSGSIWVDCSTVNPSFTKNCAYKAKQKGMRFIDAPVGGSLALAEKGALRFFTGGDEKDVEEVRSIFECMGNTLIYMGENGKGSAIKMVNNLLLAQAIAAFSEGVLLGESLGLTQELLFSILPGGPVVAPFISAKVDKIKIDNYETEFPLKWMLKDCNLALVSANENNVQLSLTNTVKDLYQQSLNQGFGEKDFSSIFKFLTEKPKQ